MNTPEFILKNGTEWHPNLDKLSSENEPLFTTVEGIEIYHGDEFWTFTDNIKDNGNKLIANRKWDYNDGKERYKYKETIQNAIEVFKWLNNIK